jgi:uncharacterized protein (TIGR01777 family)
MPNQPRVLISGASGLLGSPISASLSGSHEIVRLVRGGAGSLPLREHSDRRVLARANREIPWEPGKALDPALVEGFDSVIHLAGESIVGRWTADKKARIRDSRVRGTATLAEALARTTVKPRTLLSASAIGYYGDRGDEILREESPVGTGFLAETSRAWEAATEPAMQAGIRVVHLRTGVVLSQHGGALDKMLLPFKLGAGGRVGSGRQWWSWIHIADIVGAVTHILRSDSLRGPVNLVAPDPATNTEFTRTLAQVLHRPAFLPMPAFVARLALGEMADAALLASQRVEPAKLAASGYAFQFPELRRALQDLLG